MKNITCKSGRQVWRTTLCFPNWPLCRKLPDRPPLPCIHVMAALLCFEKSSCCEKKKEKMLRYFNSSQNDLNLLHWPCCQSQGHLLSGLTEVELLLFASVRMESRGRAGQIRSAEGFHSSWGLNKLQALLVEPLISRFCWPVWRRDGYKVQRCAVLLDKVPCGHN